ncbi:MAG: hypothetical protein KGQ42_07630, partial [Alphaproteobacteria bacterium]|nr:hypothetical protein [Alphaproteobacteria bacterium]
RIDHHGLQIVLLLAAVAGLVIEGTRARIFAGLACALSLAVGLETAPQIVALIGAALILGPGRNRVFLGALAGGVIVALPLFSIAQSIHMCDTLGAVLRHPQDCTTGPYGHVDPFLQRVWLHQVGEAQGLLHQPHPALIISYCTLLVAGCGAALWFARSRPEQRNACLLFAAPMLMSLAVALFQLRGAYIGAGLAAPVLAQMVGAARRKGALALAGAWLASAGVLHHLIGDDLDGAMARQEVVTAAQSPSFSSMGAGCIAPATLDALAKQHAGRIMAPMDVGSYLIAATPLRVFAAPYHRNNDGNLAMYHFFLASPDAAHAQARTLGVRYVLACPETFAEIKDEPQWPRSLAAMLHDGRAPGWLVPIPMAGSAAHLYDVQ